jgi:hypothetical protein
MRVAIRTLRSVAIGILLTCTSFAGEIRLSFLRDTNVVQDTVKLFQQLKCSPEGIAAFEKAVFHYYESGFEFDLSNFPQSSNGWYSFSSATQLVTALPGRISETRHAFEINCFDTVVLLANDQFLCGLDADDPSATILAPQAFTNEIRMVQVATARDAFAVSAPQWYLDVTSTNWPSILQQRRAVLNSVLYRWRMIPFSSHPGRAEDVLKMLHASWKHDGVIFPDLFEIVLFHESTFPAVITMHAGILFPRKNGYGYIEKAGGQGPFVRLEAKDKQDLMVWLSGMAKGTNWNSTDQFVTFNNREIRRMEAVK